jgi:diguanylate cyclase (GGDEF)-like protein
MAWGIALGLALALALGWRFARGLSRHLQTLRPGLTVLADSGSTPASPRESFSTNITLHEATQGVPVRSQGEAQAAEGSDRAGPNDQAFYDSLTGLPNRWLVIERLRQAIRISKRRDSSLAVLFLDIDNFTLLNELHGEEKGDLLLKEVANRLRKTVRSSDTVGRLGNDEFLVLLEELPTEPSHAAALASLVADKLRAELDLAYQLDELHCETTVSVGISFNMEGSPEEILDAAGAALLAIKRAQSYD